MKKLFTAAEIAAMNLSDLPSSTRGIQLRAKKEDWFFETRIGLGGVRKMYEIPALYLPGYVSPSANNQTLREMDEAQIAKNASAVAENVATAYEGGHIDAATLANAIEIVDTYLLDSKKQLSKQRRGEVIVVIYNYLVGNKEASALQELLKMVA